MLHKQMLKNYSIHEIMSCISCLCHLHNYLINAGAGEAPRESHEENDWDLAVSSAVPLGVRNGICLPLKLMDMGHHRDDDPLRSRCKHVGNSEELPRKALFKEIHKKNIRWPPTRSWCNNYSS